MQIPRDYNGSRQHNSNNDFQHNDNRYTMSSQNYVSPSTQCGNFRDGSNYDVDRNNLRRNFITHNNQYSQQIDDIRNQNNSSQPNNSSNRENSYDFPNYHASHNESQSHNSLCRNSFLRQLRSIPAFDGESRKDLMNFLDIGNTLNAFARNEAEYCEFIMQVCIQLRGHAKSVITDDPDWHRIKENLLKQFSYLNNRDLTNSKIESLSQNKNESLLEYADRTRKLLLEKNQCYNHLTNDQRIDHDRAIRKAFSRGIGNFSLRDRVSLRGSSSLEDAISCALEFDYDSTNSVHRSEYFCKFCKSPGHRENDCRKREQGNFQMGQLISALQTLGAGKSSNYRDNNNSNNRGGQSSSWNVSNSTQFNNANSNSNYGRRNDFNNGGFSRNNYSNNDYSNYNRSNGNNANYSRNNSSDYGGNTNRQWNNGNQNNQSTNNYNRNNTNSNNNFGNQNTNNQTTRTNNSQGKFQNFVTNENVAPNFHQMYPSNNAGQHYSSSSNSEN